MEHSIWADPYSVPYSTVRSTLRYGESPQFRYRVHAGRAKHGQLTFVVYLISISRFSAVSDSSFERASVLFNVGALMSQIAAAQKQIVDDELKTMARLFQQSAGVFLKLRDSVLGLVQQEPTADLMPETLNALSALMIAQAQEAIYLKAAKGNKMWFLERK